MKLILVTLLACMFAVVYSRPEDPLEKLKELADLLPPKPDLPKLLDDARKALRGDDDVVLVDVEEQNVVQQPQVSLNPPSIEEAQEEELTRTRRNHHHHGGYGGYGGGYGGYGGGYGGGGYGGYGGGYGGYGGYGR